MILPTPMIAVTYISIEARLLCQMNSSRTCVVCAFLPVERQCIMRNEMVNVRNTMTLFGPQWNWLWKRKICLLLDGIQFYLKLYIMKPTFFTGHSATPHERFFNFEGRSALVSSVPTWISSPGRVFSKEILLRWREEIPPPTSFIQILLIARLLTKVLLMFLPMQKRRSC